MMPTYSDRGYARALFPDLASQADAFATTRNHTSKDDPLETWIAGRTERMRSGFYGRVLARYPDAASETALSRAFRAAETLTGRLGISLPEPEDFFAAGASPQHPEPNSGLEFVPVPAPHGLGAGPWLRVLDGSVVTRMPELTLSTEVTRWFAALDWVTDSARPQLTVRERVGPIVWTLRWVPSSVQAPLLGEPYRSERSHAYPTLPELLMLDAIHQSTGAAPIDTHTFTWIGGDLPDPLFTARHVFDAGTDSIRIGVRERTDQGAHIGSRLTAQ